VARHQFERTTGRLSAEFGGSEGKDRSGRQGGHHHHHAGAGRLYASLRQPIPGAFYRDCRGTQPSEKSACRLSMNWPRRPTYPSAPPLRCRCGGVEAETGSGTHTAAIGDRGNSPTKNGVTVGNTSIKLGHCRKKSLLTRARTAAVRASGSYYRLLPLAKTQEELVAEARVGERTIDDAAKAHDAGMPELFDAVKKGKISAAWLVCPGRPCGSALRFPVGAPPSAPLDITRKSVGTQGFVDAIEARSRLGGRRARTRRRSAINSYEYLDKARELQGKISANGGDHIKSQLLGLEKTRAELAAEAQVHERTIRDAAKAHDAGSPELFDAVKKGKISAASLVCPPLDITPALRCRCGGVEAASCSRVA
jgi:hypothetical protein